MESLRRLVSADRIAKCQVEWGGEDTCWAPAQGSKTFYKSFEVLNGRSGGSTGRLWIKNPGEIQGDLLKKHGDLGEMREQYTKIQDTRCWGGV
jgi:hypothetical protein